MNVRAPSSVDVVEPNVVAAISSAEPSESADSALRLPRCVASSSPVVTTRSVSPSGDAASDAAIAREERRRRPAPGRRRTGRRSPRGRRTGRRATRRRRPPRRGGRAPGRAAAAWRAERRELERRHLGGQHPASGRRSAVATGGRAAGASPSSSNVTLASGASSTPTTNRSVLASWCRRRPQREVEPDRALRRVERAEQCLGLHVARRRRPQPSPDDGPAELVPTSRLAARRARRQRGARRLRDPPERSTLPRRRLHRRSSELRDPVQRGRSMSRGRRSHRRRRDGRRRRSAAGVATAGAAASVDSTASTDRRRPMPVRRAALRRAVRDSGGTATCGRLAALRRAVRRVEPRAPQPLSQGVADRSSRRRVHRGNLAGRRLGRPVVSRGSIRLASASPARCPPLRPRGVDGGRAGAIRTVSPGCSMFGC